ncbi:unnamed protein product [Alopecurus aequalis]
MGGDPPALKRPKLEKDESTHSHRPSSANGAGPRPPSSASASTSSASDAPPPPDEDGGEDMSEEAALALIAHRERVVEQCSLKLAQYKSQLDKAEGELAAARSKLARYRDRAARNRPPTQREPKPSQPTQKPPAPQTRPQLVIPGTNSRPAARPTPPPRTEPVPKLKKAAADPSSSSSKKADKKPKREIVQREPQNLIQSVRKSSPTILKFYGGHLVSSQHKRKLRCLELCPANDQLAVTSALDGMVTLWQVQSSGPSISLLSTTNCLSPKLRWPEDVAWHPDGDTIFAVYSSDNGDSQVSMTNLNASGQKKVNFLPAKPHTKGIINNINFMPWSDTCFLTAGSDHAVILWQEKDDSWNHRKVHKDSHSSAVNGVAGLQQKKTIISVGSDKRIISYDLAAERVPFCT